MLDITAEERQLLTTELPKLPRELKAVVNKLLVNYDKQKCFENLELEDLPGEEWRDIVDYEGLYQVSSKRRVKSFHHSKVKILRQGFNPSGYSTVSLHKNGKPKTRLVHRLVAQAFIPNPENKPEVDHKDNNRGNANVENLQWVTSSENTQAAVQRGTVKSGTESFHAKLTADEVRYIRRVYKPYDRKYGIRALARKFKLSLSAIADVIHYRTYKNVD